MLLFVLLFVLLDNTNAQDAIKAVIALRFLVLPTFSRLRRPSTIMDRITLVKTRF